MKELKLKINGMACEGCENRVDANHTTGMVIINLKKDLDIDQIKEKITDIGYDIVEG